MGFSVSASFAVAVIAGFIALGMLYPAVSGGFESVSQASQDAGERRLAAINTDINITSACVDGSTDELTIEVENTGSTGLNLNRTHVLVGNDYQVSFESRSVGGNADTLVWAPGQTATLVYSVTAQSNIESIAPDPGRVTVATEHGVRDSAGTTEC